MALLCWAWGGMLGGIAQQLTKLQYFGMGLYVQICLVQLAFPQCRIAHDPLSAAYCKSLPLWIALDDFKKQCIV